MEQLALIDHDVDRVRAEAAAGACRAAEGLRAVPEEDETFTVSAREFVRGAVEPPEEVDRDDFERCVGKVVLGLRRNGDRLSGARLQVRYHARTGRVVSITLQRDDDPSAQRQVYRRLDLGPPAAG